MSAPGIGEAMPPAGYVKATRLFAEANEIPTVHLSMCGKEQTARSYLEAEAREGGVGGADLYGAGEGIGLEIMAEERPAVAVCLSTGDL